LGFFFPPTVLFSFPEQVPASFFPFFFPPFFHLDAIISILFFFVDMVRFQLFFFPQKGLRSPFFFQLGKETPFFFLHPPPILFSFPCSPAPNKSCLFPFFSLKGEISCPFFRRVTFPFFLLLCRQWNFLFPLSPFFSRIGFSPFPCARNPLPPPSS